MAHHKKPHRFPSVPEQTNKLNETKYGLLHCENEAEIPIMSRSQIDLIINDRKKSFHSRVPEKVLAFLRGCLMVESQATVTGPNDSIPSELCDILESQRCYSLSCGLVFLLLHESSKVHFKIFRIEGSKIKSNSKMQIYMPCQIDFCEIFEGCSPPIAVISAKKDLIGFPLVMERLQQKLRFNYGFQEIIIKAVLIKDRLAALDTKGKLYEGGIGSQLKTPAFMKGKKCKELAFSEQGAVILTRDFVIIVMNLKGQQKCLIRTGIEINHIIPLAPALSCFMFMFEFDGAIWELEASKVSSGPRRLRKITSGIGKLNSAKRIGKWIYVSSSEKVLMVDIKESKGYEVSRRPSAGLVEAIIFLQPMEIHSIEHC